MFHLLRRHPFPVEAHFRHSVVLTYAYPAAVLEPLLPPGLTLDTHHGLGFLAIALVETVGLRPAVMPRFLGQDFFLAGYRLFVRRKSGGQSLRGLRVLRSDTDRRVMSVLGDLFTHYAYTRSRASMREEGGKLHVSVVSPGGEADLDVVVDLATKPAPLPPGSPFSTVAEAEEFAGPLPFTFDYERETGSLVIVKGVRTRWSPEPVSVLVRKNTFLERGPFAGVPPLLANAFHLQDVPYRWLRGRVEPAEPARADDHPGVETPLAAERSHVD